MARLSTLKQHSNHQPSRCYLYFFTPPYLKEGGPELYSDVYGSINWYWELQDTIPSARKFVEASMKKFNMPPGDYGAYSYSGVLEVARGVELAKTTDSEAVANALRKSPVYDHFKGSAT